MERLQNHKVGMVLGGVMGTMHLVWSLFVMFGVAQWILDWIYSVHFLINPFNVTAFNLITAVILIVFTSIVGYVIGYFFAMLWNRMHGRN